MPEAVIVEHLVKRFGSSPGPAGWLRRFVRRPPERPAPSPALDGVSLEVRPGEVLGIVGSNGAGKTTLLRVLCTLIRPDSGRVFVNGVWIGPEPLGDEAERRVRRSVGLAVGEERSFYWRLTGRANLEFFAALYGLGRDAARMRIRAMEPLLDMTGLLDRPVSNCSAGMRQRLAIARSLLADPPVLLLDEPTHGLDPSSGRIVKDLIRDLAQRAGKTILFVTTRLDDAEEVCDRIALMHKGKVLAVHACSMGRAATGKTVLYRFRLIAKAPAGLAGRLAAIPGVSETKMEEPRNGPAILSCRLERDRESLPVVLGALSERGCLVAEIRSEPETLEDLFHRLIPSSSGTV